MKPRFYVPLVVLSFITWVITSAFTINGGAPASTAGMTPKAVGTSTPVAVIACNTSLNASGPTLYFNLCVSGGTAGTDGCYCAPAAAASPCAAASPAPNAGTQAGWPFPTGGSFFACNPLNYPSAGGGSIINSEWDCVCTAASMKMTAVTLP